MNENYTPIWIQAGLAMAEFRDLPWPEKRELLYRYRGRPIHDACGECGQVIRWKIVWEWKQDFIQLVEIYAQYAKGIEAEEESYNRYHSQLLRITRLHQNRVENL